MNNSRLFSSKQIGDLIIDNRAVVSPMTRISATADGIPTDRMTRYYERFARGGFGLIISEGTYMDRAWSQTYKYQGGLTDDAQAAGWARITAAVHNQNALMFAQIQHGGALSQGNRFKDETMAPSSVQPRGEQLGFYRGEGSYSMPKALTGQQIDDIIQNFADAAERAITLAGFDGIEIHGANGYLLDQFFTDYTNQRQDEWNGTIVDRLALPIAVIQRVKERVGKAVPVGIRISQGKVNDLLHKWPEGEAGAQQVFRALAKTDLDFLHITEHKAWEPAFADNEMSLAALAKTYAPALTIIANGQLEQPARTDQILESAADFVAIGKGALANPDWPRKVRTSQRLESFDKALLSPLASIKDIEIAS